MAKRRNTHVFRGKTCTEAIRKARAKLGKNILIVNRRNVRIENLFSKLTSGKLGGDSVEVELEVEVGSPGEQPEAPAARSETPGRPNSNQLLDKTYAKARELAENYAKSMTNPPKAEIGEAATGIAGRLDDIKQVVEMLNRENKLALERANQENREMRDEFRRLLSLQARGGMPVVRPELLAEYQRLVEEDIAEDLARELVEELETQAQKIGVTVEVIRRELCKSMARRIPAAGPILLKRDGPTVVALIGPTGVGKSTTIAKLAVDFSMHHGKSVGLINEDRSRPGADSQLKNLGQIMGLRAVTADSPEETARFIRSMSDLDLILLDTGGRSPRDKQGLDELAAFIKAARPDETHLVIPTGLAEKTTLEVAGRFRKVGFDRIILTKLDEAMTHGAIINIAAKLADGLSYVTTGPKYTESLVAADCSQLAGLVMGSYAVTDGGIGLNRSEAGGEPT